LIMSQKPEIPSGDIPNPVTTIIFEVRSVPAALYKVLGGFATNGINLTKLESYIGGQEMNAARFYVDAEGHPQTKSMQNALEEMNFYSEPNSVKIIGTYSRKRKY
ncbi:MAG: prephenate dehydratase, partial [Flavobacteriales bacterium]|nr:prephenate dehydratase [Flavobacteriales bacterium]